MLYNVSFSGQENGKTYNFEVNRIQSSINITISDNKNNSVTKSFEIQKMSVLLKDYILKDEDYREKDLTKEILTEEYPEIIHRLYRSFAASNVHFNYADDYNLSKPDTYVKHIIGLLENNCYHLPLMDNKIDNKSVMYFLKKDYDKNDSNILSLYDMGLLHKVDGKIEEGKLSGELINYYVPFDVQDNTEIQPPAVRATWMTIIDDMRERIKRIGDPQERFLSDTNNEIKTSEYVVAYIDMLGTSNRANDPETSNLFLKRLRCLYKTIKESPIRKVGNELKIRLFSDTVIVAIKLSGQYMRTENIRAVLHWATYFQSYSVTHEINCLVRGCVTIGELFIDELNESIVYGSALVRAVKLENSIAIYPRIIIDPEKLPAFQSYEETRSFLSEDFDGIYFLNYMKYLEVMEESARKRFEKIKKGFEKIKSEAQHNMEKELKILQKRDGKCDDDVSQKLNWHLNYINKELSKNKSNTERLSL
jgi:hypothetical protein